MNMSKLKRFLTPHAADRECLAKLSDDVDDMLSDLDATVEQFKDRITCKKISRKSGSFLASDLKGESA